MPESSATIEGAALESRERLEELLGHAMKQQSFLWEYQSDFNFFFNMHVKGGGSAEQIRECIEARKLWVEMKKAGAPFLRVVESRVDESLSKADYGEAFDIVCIYEALDDPDLEFIERRMLFHPSVRDHNDGSILHQGFGMIERGEEQAAIRTLMHIIRGYVSDHGNGIGTQMFKRNISVATSTLKSVAGDDTLPLLAELAESEQSFRGWFEVNKIGLSSKAYAPFSLTESKEAEKEVFDETVEAERLRQMEEEMKRPQAYASTDGSDDWGLDDGYPDDHLGSIPSTGWKSPVIERDSATSFRSSVEEPIDPFDDGLSVEGSSDWERDLAVNFTGRYGVSIEEGSQVEVSGENYISALNALASKEKVDSPLDYFHFIGNMASKESIEDSVPLAISGERAMENAYRMAGLAYARAQYRSKVGGYIEESAAELKLAREYLASHAAQAKKPAEASFLRSLGKRLQTLETVIRSSESNPAQPPLPQSAEAFLMYNSKLNKKREIPAYRTLLDEKVRRYLSLDMMNNFNAIKLEGDDRRVRPVLGPSFERFRSITDLFFDNLREYASVESIDVPFYWEAADRLDDFDADKCVVFGRDGRYFFTALKALDFGLDTRDLIYLVVTRNIQNKMPQEDITRYIKEHGATLDHTFIDTGFQGSIPELAINCLATDAGVTLTDEQIDERIKLLESTRRSRTDLSRRKSVGIVGRIEDEREKKIESPSCLALKNGKLEPVEVPTSIDSQLKAWTVEHAVMRSFAPRFDGDKKIAYLKEDPLEGFEYVSHMSSDAISTHPLEIWQNESGEKVVVKGGPEHTLRAEYVGAELFKKLHIPTPSGELIKTDDGLRYKMDFLENCRGGGLELPEEYQNSEDIQQGLLADMLLGQYDRTPWNLMFGENGSVHFIDHGACLNSRARGGYKGFSEKFTVEEFAESLKNPQFEGRPVNEAYANLVEIKDGKVVIRDHERMSTIFRRFRSDISSDVIDRLIEQAGYVDGRKSLGAIEKKAAFLENSLNSLQPGSSDYKKTMAALETFDKMREAGGEAAYFKRALSQRFDDICRMMRDALGEENQYRY